jgi:putative hemolysin
MQAILLELVILAMLILTNGLLAMIEIALVSARRTRLQSLAERGDNQARMALKLLDSPNRFLAAIQIGITLVGILAGAYGGATLAEALNLRLSRIPALAPISEAISLALVVSGITYLSLVFGELVPKRLGLNKPEQIALGAAPAMQALARLAAPFIQLLSLTTDVVLRLLGVRPSGDLSITEEDIKAMIQQGVRSGLLAEAEHDLFTGVFRLGDRRAENLMTPRTEMDWLDLEDPPEVIRRAILTSSHSYFPVARGSLDNLIGVASAKDLLAWGVLDNPKSLGDCLSQPLFVPRNMPALQVVDRLRSSDLHMALVIDEYGGLLGLISPLDILGAIVGSAFQAEYPESQRSEDGSWLLDGLLPVDQLKEVLGIQSLPAEAGRHYQTLGGLVTTHLGRIPRPGEKLILEGLVFEVLKMDGHRVDQVRVFPAPKPEIPN